MNIVKFITLERAAKICGLLKKPFKSLSSNTECVEINFSEVETHSGNTISIVLQIFSNGKVSCWNDTGVPELRSFNALPVTDFLRQEGFEFQY